MLLYACGLVFLRKRLKVALVMKKQPNMMTVVKPFSPVSDPSEAGAIY
jgi:hypothetical protein